MFCNFAKLFKKENKFDLLRDCFSLNKLTVSVLKEWGFLVITVVSVLQGTISYTHSDVTVKTVDQK